MPDDIDDPKIARQGRLLPAPDYIDDPKLARQAQARATMPQQGGTDGSRPTPSERGLASPIPPKPRRGSRNDTPLYSDPTILDTMPPHPMLRSWGGDQKRKGKHAIWPNATAGLWFMANDWQALAAADRRAGRPVRGPIQWGDAAVYHGGPFPRDKPNIHGKKEALGHRGNDIDIAVVGGKNASPGDEQRTIELMQLAIKHGAKELYFDGVRTGTFKTPLPPDVKDKVRDRFLETDHFHARWTPWQENFSPAQQ